MRLLNGLAVVVVAFSASITLSQTPTATDPSGAASDTLAATVADSPRDRSRGRLQLEATRESVALYEADSPTRMSRDPVQSRRDGRARARQTEQSVDLRVPVGRSRNR